MNDFLYRENQNRDLKKTLQEMETHLLKIVEHWKTVNALTKSLWLEADTVASSTGLLEDLSWSTNMKKIFDNVNKEYILSLEQLTVTQKSLKAFDVSMPSMTTPLSPPSSRKN